MRQEQFQLIVDSKIPDDIDTLMLFCKATELLSEFNGQFKDDNELIKSFTEAFAELPKVSQFSYPGIYNNTAGKTFWYLQFGMTRFFIKFNPSK